MEEENQPQMYEYPGAPDVLSALNDILDTRDRLPERIDIKQVGGPEYVAKVYYPGEDVWEPYHFYVDA